MYTKFLVKQLIHLHDKEFLSGIVCELGTSKWDTKINKWLKSSKPHFRICETAPEFFDQIDCELRQFQSIPKRKFDNVIATGNVMNSLDNKQCWTEVINTTNVGGHIIYNGPVGIHGAVANLTPAGAAMIAELNQMDILYMAVAHEHAEYIEKFDAHTALREDDLTKILYKFRETQELRLAVTFRKNVDKELVL